MKCAKDHTVKEGRWILLLSCLEKMWFKVTPQRVICRPILLKGSSQKAFQTVGQLYGRARTENKISARNLYKVWKEKKTQEQEAFEKCWAHSPLRAAARCLFYIAINQVSLLSHSACASMSTTTTTTTATTRDIGDRYGPMEWAQPVMDGKD